MAVLFIDGYSHYGTANIDEKYSTVSEVAVGGDGTIAFTIAPEGRFDQCLKKVVTGGGFTSSGFVEKAILMTQSGPWTPTASGVIGFALKVDDINNVRTSVNNHRDAILEIQESGFTGLYLGLNANGTFCVYRQSQVLIGDASLQIGTSLEGIRDNTWAYVEFKWSMHASTGFVEVRVNGVQVLRFDGNTMPTSFAHGFTGVWTSFRLLNTAGATATPLTIRLADLYCFDLTGSFNNDFVGDVSIDYITTNGTGNAASFSSSTGDANWMNVDEVPPDCGSSYNHAVVPTTRDSFAMQDVPPGTTPIAYQALLSTRKENEGAASLQVSFRPPGGPYHDSPTQGVATVASCTYIVQPYDTNPATGTTITAAELNAAEFGYEKVV